MASPANERQHHRVSKTVSEPGRTRVEPLTCASARAHGRRWRPEVRRLAGVALGKADSP